AEATANVSGQLRVSNARLREVLNEPALAGTLDASAAFTASGKTVESLIATLGGSGTAGVSELAVNGINPNALAELLRASDGYGAEIDATAIDAFSGDL